MPSKPSAATLVAAARSPAASPIFAYGPLIACRPLALAATSVAALGFDGKWVLHPGQVDVVNEVFTPSAADYARAIRILDAYRQATEVDRRGAGMLDDEMIDEASRKMALAVAAKGAAAGLPRPS